MLENNIGKLRQANEKPLLNGFLFFVFNFLLFIKQRGNFTTISNQNNFHQALIYRIEFP